MTAKPSSNLPILSCVSTGNWRTVIHGFDEDAVFIIDGSTGKADDLFRQFASVLPLDPPLGGAVNWDALADSLWSGLDDFEHDRVVIVVLGADKLAASNLMCLLDLADTLLGVARSIADPKTGVFRSVQLFTLFVGDGPSFPPSEIA